MFQIITRDKWWQIKRNIGNGSFTAFGEIYCVLIIILMTYFLANMILAVILQSLMNEQDPIATPIATATSKRIAPESGGTNIDNTIRISLRKMENS